MDKVLKDRKKMSKPKDMREIEYIIKAFNTVYPMQDNMHVNLVDVFITLTNEHISMYDKISKLMNYNLLVLDNCATNFCKKWFSSLSNMELFMLLLDYYDEDVIRIFKYYDEEPDVFFRQIIYVCGWFKTQNM